MRLGFVLVLLPIGLTVASCFGPTEIMVGVTTNACASLTRTDVYVGGGDRPVATQAGGCPDAHSLDVGDLAITPSGSIDATVDIVVVGALGAACKGRLPTDSQCIVARRTLSFAPHQRLDLPVFLDSACAGTYCPAGSTCVAGATGPTCVGAICNGPGGVSCDADGGGPILVDAAPDAPTGCPTIVPFAGTPTLSWSFDGASDAVHEDQDRTAPEAFTSGGITDDPPVFCGHYLSTIAGTQSLAASVGSLESRSFTLAFAYRSTADGGLLQLGSVATNGGLVIELNMGVLVVDFMGDPTPEVYRGSMKREDGVWHTAVVQVRTTVSDAGVATSTLSVNDDGALKPVQTTAGPYHAASASLTAGPIAAIDQISLFVP